MKKTILGLTLLLAAAMVANAQQPDQPMNEAQGQHQKHQRHRGQHGDMMAKKLHFSEAQQQQLKSINADYHKKITDLKNHDEVTMKEFKSQMGALHKEHRAQIAALLTPAQKDELAKMKQQRMDMAKANASARAEKLKVKLNLSDTQASQLKDIRTGMMSKIKSIHTDTTLSHDQKKEQIKGLVMQQKEQLKTILTPEQMQQLQQMKGQHHRRDFSK